MSRLNGFERPERDLCGRREFSRFPRLDFDAPVDIFVPEAAKPNLVDVVGCLVLDTFSTFYIGEGVRNAHLNGLERQPAATRISCCMKYELRGYGAE